MIFWLPLWFPLNINIKEGIYIVNFFLLFLNKSQKDPTFGFYNLAYSDVTKSWEDIYELQKVMLHQHGRRMVVFCKKLNSFMGGAA